MAEFKRFIVTIDDFISVRPGGGCAPPHQVLGIAIARSEEEVRLEFGKNLKDGYYVRTVFELSEVEKSVEEVKSLALYEPLTYTKNRMVKRIDCFVIPNDELQA